MRAYLLSQMLSFLLFSFTLAAQAPAHQNICRTIEVAAANNGLPVDFFARLIWQESKFDPNAISSAGAQGIAQFMPRTAAGRGTFNPFNPDEALMEAAGYLSELRKTFGGNLGLAAAAYNAGPTRLTGWLNRTRELARETYNYVQTITGRSLVEWASHQPPEWQVGPIPREIPCGELATLLAERVTRQPERQQPAWQPWGVQVAGNWKEGQVLASFERLRRQMPNVIGERQPIVFKGRSAIGRAIRYVIRIGEPTRQQADALCARIQAAQGACLVLKNPVRSL